MRTQQNTIEDSGDSTSELLNVNPFDFFIPVVDSLSHTVKAFRDPIFKQKNHKPYFQKDVEKLFERTLTDLKFCLTTPGLANLTNFQKITEGFIKDFSLSSAYKSRTPEKKLELKTVDVLLMQEILNVLAILESLCSNRTKAQQIKDSTEQSQMHLSQLRTSLSNVEKTILAWKEELKSVEQTYEKDIMTSVNNSSIVKNTEKLTVRYNEILSKYNSKNEYQNKYKLLKEKVALYERYLKNKSAQLTARADNLFNHNVTPSKHALLIFKKEISDFITNVQLCKNEYQAEFKRAQSEVTESISEQFFTNLNKDIEKLKTDRDHYSALHTQLFSYDDAHQEEAFRKINERLSNKYNGIILGITKAESNLFRLRENYINNITLNASAKTQSLNFNEGDIPSALAESCESYTATLNEAKRQLNEFQEFFKQQKQALGVNRLSDQDNDRYTQLTKGLSKLKNEINLFEESLKDIGSYVFVEKAKQLQDINTCIITLQENLRALKTFYTETQALDVEKFVDDTFQYLLSPSFIKALTGQTRSIADEIDAQLQYIANINFQPVEEMVENIENNNNNNEERAKIQKLQQIIADLRESCNWYLNTHDNYNKYITIQTALNSFDNKQNLPITSDLLNEQIEIFNSYLIQNKDTLTARDNHPIVTWLKQFVCTLVPSAWLKNKLLIDQNGVEFIKQIDETVQFREPSENYNKCSKKIQKRINNILSAPTPAEKPYDIVPAQTRHEVVTKIAQHPCSQFTEPYQPLHDRLSNVIAYCLAHPEEVNKLFPNVKTSNKQAMVTVLQIEGVLKDRPRVNELRFYENMLKKLLGNTSYMKWSQDTVAVVAKSDIKLSQ